MKGIAQLDGIDRRILRALQQDASISHAALGELVGASSASCWRRIRALEEAGVLRNHVRLVAPALVGRGVSVMLQVRLKSHALPEVEAFESFLRGRPEIMECHSMSGDWDYLMRIVVADVSDYQRFLMDEMLRLSNVAASTSHFALSEVKYTTALPV